MRRRWRRSERERRQGRVVIRETTLTTKNGQLTFQAS
jgi:hypothetical protein